MRGVSAIIAIILIIMIVVTIAAMIYTFSSGIFTSTTSAAEESINTTTKGLFTNMKIESVMNDKIFVRNVGQSDITEIGLFIGDSPAEYYIDKSPIPPGSIATITIKKIFNETAGSYEIPSGEIKLSSVGGIPLTYKGYSGYTCGSFPEIVNQQTFSYFPGLVNGYNVKATACDADGLWSLYCEIYYKREKDLANMSLNYNESYSYPEAFNMLNGDCNFNISTTGTGFIQWSNPTAAVYNHGLILDNDYVYVVNRNSVVYKYLKSDGSLVMSNDVGTGITVRGLSDDGEFLYFGDYNFNLTKVRKSDLQRELTVKYGLVTQNYAIYSTAVDDTGVYWGNSMFNVSKVSKTDLKQILWSRDYSTAVNSYVTDMDVDESYLYFTNAVNGSVTKLDKNTGALIWMRNQTPHVVGNNKYSLILEGNNLWTVDYNLVLWQIDKVTGDTISSTDLGSGTAYEIVYDNDFLYVSTSSGDILKVNKTSKEMEYLLYSGYTNYGLDCDTNDCFLANSLGAGKIFKDLSSQNFKSGDRITSWMYFNDGENITETYKATNMIP